MRLRRYVLSELIMPFLFSFSVIIFLLVIDLILQMLDRILGKGLPISVVFELFFFNTAWMIALAVPMAVLVSTLLAFGRLSAAGEIVANASIGHWNSPGCRAGTARCRTAGNWAGDF